VNSAQLPSYFWPPRIGCRGMKQCRVRIDSDDVAAGLAAEKCLNPSSGIVAKREEQRNSLETISAKMIQ
jgi:hypothetical protein